MNLNLPSSPPLSFKKYLYIILGVIILLIVSVFVILWQKQLINLPFINKSVPQNPAEKIIAKAGEENIYQKDLDRLIARTPKDQQPLSSSASAERTKQLKNQLAQESVILQGAAADGLIKLDPAVFNSPSKDYQKREGLVKTAITAIDNQTDGVSGQVIAVWFKSPSSSASGSLQLSADKKTASAKINTLYQDLKNNKITPDQAIEKIKNDKNFTSFNFTAVKDNPITTSAEFDKILKKLKTGGLTEPFLMKENAYFMGLAKQEISTGKIASFNDWLSQKQKQYKVILY